MRFGGADEPLEIQDQSGYLPIVGVNGKEIWSMASARYAVWCGSLKTHNVCITIGARLTPSKKALAPKAPVLVTAKQIQGLEDVWQDALSGNPCRI